MSMAHVITFETSKFDPRDEPKNRFNPIAGHSVLVWLRSTLAGTLALSDPDAEDWGWYSTGSLDGATYLVGASSDIDEGGAQPVQWVIQIERHRRILDRLVGRNRMEANDRASAAIHAAIKNEPAFTNIELEIDS